MLVTEVKLDISSPPKSVIVVIDRQAEERFVSLTITTLANGLSQLEGRRERKESVKEMRLGRDRSDAMRMGKAGRTSDGRAGQCQSWLGWGSRAQRERQTHP